MPGRKLNALEQRLHQTALADSEKTLTQAECDALIPDKKPRVDAINFLLGTGLFRAARGSDGTLSYRAVTKNELDVRKDLAGEENLVLSHIQAAGNEGIWTKHLKAKTELHQTIIDRCLKSLVQKDLVKGITGVKVHPTRKLYMLAHLEPSVDITGGPWYTDKELDTEFIKLLSSACLRFIRDKTFPKSNTDKRPLYSISSAPSYTTAQQIQAFLSKSKITETQLSVEHVEMLLNVLIIDGEIEKIPAFGGALWEASAAADKSDDEEATPKSKRSRRSSSVHRGRDDDEDSAGEGSSRRRSRKSSKHVGSASDSEGHGSTKKSPQKSRGRGDDTGDDEPSSRRKSRSRSKRGRSTSLSSSDLDSSPIKSEQDSPPRKRSRKRSPSPQQLVAGMSIVDDYGGAFVYRAIRQEHVALGWSQAPCGRCPQFDFCSDKGPVNPRECEYYGEWLRAGAVKIE
ncbi:hypothetical protein BD410DRAFT_756850 [Rickenella mellea]|uniref:RNA polymerase III subunit C6 n=1 Tax=Rickenella mellea TaxID=50990 RepID=A0A4Y7PIC4_9AGAM|nr:hypothetical protein BD410DRAFT_756850 [Rickenella mellea]